jgi:hypothetical protein
MDDHPLLSRSQHDLILTQIDRIARTHWRLARPLFAFPAIRFVLSRDPGHELLRFEAIPRHMALAMLPVQLLRLHHASARTGDLRVVVMALDTDGCLTTEVDGPVSRHDIHFLVAGDPANTVHSFSLPSLPHAA